MESLNDLINLAQFILDNGFDPQAFLTWKEAAFICLLGLLGPLHFYTKSFGRVTGKPMRKGFSPERVCSLQPERKLLGL